MYVGGPALLRCLIRALALQPVAAPPPSPPTQQCSTQSQGPFPLLAFVQLLCFVQLVVSGQALETWEMGLGPGAGLAKGGAFCRIQWRPAPYFVRCLHDTVPSQWGRADTALYVVARLRGAPAARMHACMQAQTHERTHARRGAAAVPGATALLTSARSKQPLMARRNDKDAHQREAETLQQCSPFLSRALCSGHPGPMVLTTRRRHSQRPQSLARQLRPKKQSLYS